MLNIIEFPDQVFKQILSYLKQIDLIYASRVNKKFNFFCSNNELQKIAADTSPDKPLLKYISEFVYNYRAVSRLPGKQIAIGCVDGTIQVWDYEKESIIKSISGYSDYQKNKQVLCITFIGSEKILSAAYDNALRVYEYRTGECLHVLSLPSSVKTMTLLTTEKVALGLYNGFIYILNLETLKFDNMFRNSGSWVLGLTKLSGTELATCSQDGMVRIWNYHTGECISELTDIANTRFNWSNYVVNLGNGTIGSCHDDGFRVWNYKTGICLKSILIEKRPFRKDIPAAFQTGEIAAEVKCVVALNLSKGKVLCRYGNGVMRVWNYISGECLQVIHDHRKAVLYTQQPSVFLDIPTEFSQEKQAGNDVNVTNIDTERHNYQLDEQGQMHLQAPKEYPECLEERTHWCTFL